MMPDRKGRLTTKTYVVLRPHSNTNPSAKHQVVDFDTWRAYVDGETTTYAVASAHDDHASAQTAADKLNGRTP